MTMIRIASVSNENEKLFSDLMGQHRLPFRLDRKSESGYDVFIELNHETYFREVFAPEYKAAKAITPEVIREVMGKANATN